MIAKADARIEKSMQKSYFYGSLGEVAERSKARAWKARVRFIAYRGFESLSLRNEYQTEEQGVKNFQDYFNIGYSLLAIEYSPITEPVPFPLFHQSNLLW